jgi:oxygen-independent coproporphyrinogen-3 oxidase
VIGKAGYQRYEVSNFALSGKRSLHNMVYWTGGSYLGLGMYASSYLAREHIEQEVQEARADVTGEDFSKSATTATATATTAACGRRRKHTEHRKDYLAGKYVDEASVHELDEKESRIERVILGLRTDRGLPHYESYADLFVPAWKDLLGRYEQEGLVITDGDRLVLTPAGRDVYNTLITDFMVEV